MHTKILLLAYDLPPDKMIYLDIETYIIAIKKLNPDSYVATYYYSIHDTEDFMIDYSELEKLISNTEFSDYAIYDSHCNSETSFLIANDLLHN